MKLKNKILALVATLTLSNSSFASGIPTIDAASLSQAVMEYQQMLKDYDQAMQRYEELKNTVSELKTANGLYEVANSLSQAGNDLMTATDTTTSFLNDWDSTYSSLIDSTSSLYSSLSGFKTTDYTKYFQGDNGSEAQQIYNSMGLGKQCDSYSDQEVRNGCKMEAASIARRKADTIARLSSQMDAANPHQGTYASTLKTLDSYSQGKTPDGRTLTSVTDYVQAQYALQLEMAKFAVVERQFEAAQKALAQDDRVAEQLKSQMRKAVFYQTTTVSRP